MHFAHWNKGHFARFENSMLFADPLLGLTGNDEDQLFASWMIMKRMGAKWLHVGAHQKQVLVFDHVRATHPFLKRPRGLKSHRVRRCNEAPKRERSWIIGRLHGRLFKGSEICEQIGCILFRQRF